MEDVGKERCGDCRYWIQFNDMVGRCVRFPRQRTIKPLVNALGGISHTEDCNYPLQAIEDWCGEFTAGAQRPRETPQEQQPQEVLQ